MNRALLGALALLALQVGCAGHVSQSPGQGRAMAASDEGASGSVSGGVQGLGLGAGASPSSAAGSGGAPLPGDGGVATATMSQTGTQVSDAGIAVADAGLSEPISDADLRRADLAAAGCHSVSRNISCLGLPTPNVCVFLSDGRVCKADRDCDWLIIPDCCCTAPRYILDDYNANLGAACGLNECYHRFVLPG